MVGLLLQRAAQAAAGEPTRGEVIYQRCLACHSMEHNRVGPRHCGLFGRRAGTLKGFQYSTAMKKYGVIWSKETLDHFLENPLKAVPGTKMAYAGVKDSHKRADLMQGWHAYNITSDKQFGLGSWSDEQLASYLSSARAEGRGVAAGPMAEATTQMPTLETVTGHLSWPWTDAKMLGDFGPTAPHLSACTGVQKRPIWGRRGARVPQSPGL
jgi:cytochrome c